MLFGTDGIRGEVGKYPLTQEAVFIIGKAFAVWLKQKFPQNKSLKIVIGKDTRESGDELERALLRGLKFDDAFEILRLGVCPTPVVSYINRTLGAHLGIAISASHNPGCDNGIKFFDSRGYKFFPAAEREVEEIFSQIPKESTGLDSGPLILGKEIDYFPLYLDFAKNSLGKSGLSALKIVVDCAFGSFSRIAPELFRQLGAEVIVLNDQPDGKNINVDCGTLHPQLISRSVLRHQADIGIAFDGDGDRLMICDEKGNVLDGDYMLAILAQYLSKLNKLSKKCVVCTQMSNIGLELWLKGLGIQTIRTEVGDKYVLEQMLKSKANLGGEQSGHIIILERSTTGDGLIVALELIKAMRTDKQPLSKLGRTLEKCPQVLVNIKVREKRPFEKIAGLGERRRHFQTELGSSGRILLRYSGTENLARVMVEGKEQALVSQAAEALGKVIEDAIGESK